MTVQFTTGPMTPETQRLTDYLAAVPTDRWYAFHHEPGPLFRLSLQKRRVRELTRRKYRRR